MDKTQLKRHNLVFVSKQGKEKILKNIINQYTGETSAFVEDVLRGETDIPGFLRRSEEKCTGLPLGFVHHKRIEGNRIRIGAFADADDIITIMTPYEVMQRKAFAYDAKSACIEEVSRLFSLAEIFDLHVGILGSAALEMVTGLPYTDENSDIDLLIKPAPYNRLLQFYRAAIASCENINMDFELDLPNGYGVKLAEIFMETQTVLGKSLDDVNLLSRKDIMEYLKIN